MVHSRESHLKINDLCSDTPEDGNAFRKIDAEGHCESEARENIYL